VVTYDSEPVSWFFVQEYFIRENHAFDGLLMAKENFVFDVALGGYGQKAVGLDEVWHAHNVILEIICEAGIFVGGLFVLFSFVIFH